MKKLFTLMLLVTYVGLGYGVASELIVQGQCRNTGTSWVSSKFSMTDPSVLGWRGGIDACIVKLQAGNGQPSGTYEVLCEKSGLGSVSFQYTNPRSK